MQCITGLWLESTIVRFLDVGGGLGTKGSECSRQNNSPKVNWQGARLGVEIYKVAFQNSIKAGYETKKIQLA